MHAVLLPSAKRPDEHGEHELNPAEPVTVPALQLVQVDEPATGLNVPAGQMSQSHMDVAPACDPYQPAGHFVHCEVERTML